MATERRRVEVNTDQEIQLITGLIVDDDFCRQVLPMLRPGHLDIRLVEIIISWVRDFWEQYRKAPGLEIQNIFKANQPRMKEEETNIISSYLTNLSRIYAEKERHNWSYQAELARDFLRLRNLELLTAQVKGHVGQGGLQQAEEAIRDFGAISAKTSHWVSPFSDEALILSVLQKIEQGGIFQLEGALGEVFGSWDRGWLVAYFAPYKRGKSFWMVETAVQAVIQGLKVVFVSLEMQEKSMVKRFIQNATTLPDQAGRFKIPVWDCTANQEDTCELKVRTNHVSIPTNQEGDPKYDELSDYRPCIYCKNDPDFLENFQVITWFEMIDKTEDLGQKILKRTQGFAAQYHGGNLRLICYPRFSATVHDIESDIDSLVFNDEFIPDMIVVDYADILADKGSDERDRLDKIWKKLARMAGERHAIVVTASQTTRKSMDAKSIKPTDTAEDIRKLAHIDLGISLNQRSNEKEDEKAAMVMRLGTMVRREGESTQEEVTVLQNLSLGQPAMDSWAPSVGRRLADKA